MPSLKGYRFPLEIVAYAPRKGFPVLVTMEKATYSTFLNRSRCGDFGAKVAVKRRFPGAMTGGDITPIDHCLSVWPAHPVQKAGGRPGGQDPAFSVFDPCVSRGRSPPA